MQGNEGVNSEGCGGLDQMMGGRENREACTYTYWMPFKPTQVRPGKVNDLPQDIHSVF